MKYSTRPGDRPGHAHVNYQCPCGCKAGLTYDRESGAEHLGTCCCGRLLWVGADAEARVRENFQAGARYVIDRGKATLPWGECVSAALAVPASWVPAAEAAPAGRVRDVVCGMVIRPETAAGTSLYEGQTYYFCAPICQQRFDAEPARFLQA
jgi:YHS domain-containing protein